MSSTPRLALPRLAPQQAQKHVTVNEALRRLDAVVQLGVKSRTVAAEPGGPAEGDAYILPAAKTGPAWGAMAAGALACFVDGAWSELTPKEGWRAWVQDATEFVFYDGAAWTAPSRLGVNAGADATNRLSVKSNAVLFDAIDAAEGGSGDSQVKVNKEAAGDTASHLFQTGFSGRAEFGLTGDDDFRLKVSGDGAAWKEALIADRNDGSVKFPSGLRDYASGLPVLTLIPAVVADIWRSDVNTPTATPRTYTISSVTGAVITLTETRVGEIFSPLMRDISMVRIWNTSKTPAESAWVNWDNSTTAVTVANAADIAGWLSGETIRLGDPNPTGANTLNMLAIDISNYMFNNYGIVWRQRGLKVSNAAQGVGGPVGIDYSGTGGFGTALGSLSSGGGQRQATFVDIFTTELSPISNSNLLFVRETITAPATALAASRLCRLVGIWA